MNTEEEKFQEQIVPVMIAFDKVMWTKLWENRHKGNRDGWLKCDWLLLFTLLEKEVQELRDALYDVQPAPAVVREAADVANMAMMIADHFGSCESNPPKDDEMNTEQQTYCVAFMAALAMDSGVSLEQARKVAKQFLATLDPDQVAIATQTPIDFDAPPPA